VGNEGDRRKVPRRSKKPAPTGGTSLKKRLLSGTGWAFGGKIAAATIGVVTNGLLARMLSPQEFGAYFLALSIISLGAVVGSLGLPKTVVRFVAENMGLNRFARTRRVIFTVLGLGVLGTLGVSLAYLLVGNLVGRYLFDSPVLVAVTALIAGWMAISVVQEITAETFRGFHDIRMATLLGGLATGGKSGGLVMRSLLLACVVLLWMTSGGTDLRTVMLVSIGSGAGSVLLSVWLLRAKLSSLGSRGGAKEPAQDPISSKEVLSVSIPLLMIALTAFVLQSSDIWILGALRSQEEVAVYAAASRLVALIAMPLLITNLVLPPIIAEMYAQGKTAELERTLRTFSTVSGVPALAFLAGFMLLGGPVLGLVYGDYYRSGALVLVLLSAAKVAAVWAGSCGLVLQMTNHHAQMLRVSLLTSPLSVAGALLLVRDYGPVGVASAAAATTILQNVILVLVARRMTGMWTHVVLSVSAFWKVLSNR
jgi:O-antigen/teichoic acid export membrane protein